MSQSLVPTGGLFFHLILTVEEAEAETEAEEHQVLGGSQEGACSQLANDEGGKFLLKIITLRSHTKLFVQALHFMFIHDTAICMSGPELQVRFQQ